MTTHDKVRSTVALAALALAMTTATATARDVSPGQRFVLDFSSQYSDPSRVSLNEIYVRHSSDADPRIDFNMASAVVPYSSIHKEIGIRTESFRILDREGTGLPVEASVDGEIQLQGIVQMLGIGTAGADVSIALVETATGHRVAEQHLQDFSVNGQFDLALGVGMSVDLGSITAAQAGVGGDLSAGVSLTTRLIDGELRYAFDGLLRRGQTYRVELIVRPYTSVDGIAGWSAVQFSKRRKVENLLDPTFVLGKLNQKLLDGLGVPDIPFRSLVGADELTLIPGQSIDILEPGAKTRILAKTDVEILEAETVKILDAQGIAVLDPLCVPPAPCATLFTIPFPALDFTFPKLELTIPELSFTNPDLKFQLPKVAVDMTDPLGNGWDSTGDVLDHLVGIPTDVEQLLRDALKELGKQVPAALTDGGIRLVRTAVTLADDTAERLVDVRSDVSTRASQATVDAVKTTVDRNLDASVSSRSTQSSVDAVQSSVDGVETRVDAVQSSVDDGTRFTSDVERSALRDTLIVEIDANEAKLDAIDARVEAVELALDELGLDLGELGCTIVDLLLTKDKERCVDTQVCGFGSYPHGLEVMAPAPACSASSAGVPAPALWAQSGDDEEGSPVSLGGIDPAARDRASGGTGSSAIDTPRTVDARVERRVEAIDPSLRTVIDAALRTDEVSPLLVMPAEAGGLAGEMARLVRDALAFYRDQNLARERLFAAEDALTEADARRDEGRHLDAYHAYRVAYRTLVAAGVEPSAGRSGSARTR